MSFRPATDFAQFRFLKDRSGNVVTLPSQFMEEKILLAVDCERWGLARLHIFEGAARHEDKLKAFQEEMKGISRLRSDSVSRLLSWGRDSEELFYADAMIDGEPLPDYLRRGGKLPIGVSSAWILQIADLVDAVPSGLCSFERFTTLNFEVALSPSNRVLPVFSEFVGWNKPGTQDREHSREWHLAQIFCSLMAGVPVRTFDRESLPRNFEELDGEAQAIVRACLEESPGEGGPGSFLSTMRRLAEKADSERDRVPLPHLAFRKWMHEQYLDTFDDAPEHVLSEEYRPDHGRYAVETVIRGTSTLLQFLPGVDALPREGWIPQHHEASRRPGRSMLHQLQVNYIEDREAVTLLGEEQMKGCSLAALTYGLNGFGEDLALRIVERVDRTLDILEKHVGASAVWWLPPENILFQTGTNSEEASVRFVERKGKEAWEEMPLKFRLHQTAATLREGVLLPGRIRNLAMTREKKWKTVRRVGIHLPLFYFLVTGQRFRWSSSLEEDAALSGELRNRLESIRQGVFESPETWEGNFLNILRESREREVPASDPGEVSTPRSDGLEEVLEATIYTGVVELREERGDGAAQETTGLQPGTIQLSEADRVEGPAGAREQEQELGMRRRWWLLWGRKSLWIALAGPVSSLALESVLAGWNAETALAKGGGPVFPGSGAPVPPDFALDEVLMEMGDEKHRVGSGPQRGCRASQDQTPSMRRWVGPL